MLHKDGIKGADLKIYSKNILDSFFLSFYRIMCYPM